MTDLDIIAQLERKIQQLPPQLVTETDDYVDFLLQKYRLAEDAPKKSKSLLGCLHQYANAELIPQEAHAWQNSVGMNDDSR
jgi:hypothetical protein